MDTIKISELLDELDGDGIIWTDSDLTGDALKRMGLSHDTEIEFGTNPLAAELLEALADMLDMWERHCAPRNIEFDSQVKQARAAIERATS